jgi:hypothetical protein
VAARIGFAFVAVIVLMCCATESFAQNSPVAEPYVDDDAYRVFSAVLSRPNSNVPANTLIIQQETVPHLQDPPAPFADGPEACVFPDVSLKFKDAIADYNRVNQKPWLLQRKFQIDHPYELVTSGTLRALFSDGRWDGFYKRFPASDGIFSVSAVGFNREKTLAILYGGTACGDLCGSWSFHLLEKVDGKWGAVAGVRCHTVS